MIFTAHGLSRRYRQGDAEVRALDAVDLEIAEGQIVGVAGPSGCGKSTLANVLGLLDAHFEGELLFRGRAVAALDVSTLARLRLAEIGFVFQDFQLLPMLTVRDNVALPRWHLRGDRQEARRVAEELLVRVGLAHRLAHDPSRLSGGEMQRVAVARALVNDPAVVIADEPTGSLDSRSAASVLDALLEARTAERAVVLVSHDRSVLARADRVVELVDGRVLSERVPGAQ